MAKSISLDDYSIVWLCPLPIETAAALFMLDEEHEGVVSRHQGQRIEYHFGSIGQHNVAIAGFPSGEVGIGRAGTMAEAAVRDFKNLELGLLVGIAAAIPSKDRDIRLGDVAVADPKGNYPGIISYDMVTIASGEQRLKQWMEATNPLWRSVISKIRARSTVHGETFQRHLSAFESPTGQKFNRPYNPPPLHSAFLGQDRDSDCPIVHYGPFLSGDKVVRTAEFRDQLREKFSDSVALEMEAAGVMTTIPVAVVRGISDAADHHKTDAWHPRAAAVAAAYAKEMLLQLSPKLRQSDPNAHAEKVLLRGQLPMACAFYGREEQLSTIAAQLDRVSGKTCQRSVLILSGLSGAGKSQLAAAYVRNQFEKDPRREIYWVNARDKEAFETSILQFHHNDEKSQFSTRTQVPEDANVQTSKTIETFLEGLNRVGNAGWLLVLDDVTTWNEISEFPSECFDVKEFLSKTVQGSILITTTHHNLLIGQGANLRLTGLHQSAALQFLKSSLHDHYGSEEDLLEMADMLQFLPLSLKLATTYILKRGIVVKRYIDMWNSRKLDDSLPLIEPTLVRTLNLCFEELESYLPSAAWILTLFGFLDHRFLAYDLISNATTSTLPGWLLAVSQNSFAFEEVIEALLDLSFVELSKDKHLDGCYSVHPAVHAFARLRAGAWKERYISWAISLIADNVPRSTDSDYWRYAQTLAHHANQCLVHIHTGKFPPQDLERLAALYRLIGRYEESLEIYETVLQYLSPHRNTFAETIAQVLNDMGLVYYGQQRFELAKKTFDESLQLYSSLPEHLDNGSTDTFMCIVFNYGNACRMTRDLGIAEAAFNQIYEHFEPTTTLADVTGVPLWKSIVISRVVNAFGELYLERGEVRNAISMFRRGLSCQQTLLSNTHPIALSTRMNLGRAYTSLGSYSVACEIFQSLVLDYKELFGPEHEACLMATDELATASMGYGRVLTEAEGPAGARTEAFQRAERLWADNLAHYVEKEGAESENALRTKASIAQLQSVTGDHNIARRNMLQVFQRTTNPVQRMKAQCDLALICQRMGDIDVAKLNLAQAVEAGRQCTETGAAQELARVMYHQARLYYDLGDYDTHSRVLEDMRSHETTTFNV